MLQAEVVKVLRNSILGGTLVKLKWTDPGEELIQRQGSEPIGLPVGIDNTQNHVAVKGGKIGVHHEDKTAG